MHNSSIAIAIITSYPRWYSGKLRSIKNTDKVRGDLALRFIDQVLKEGYKLVIVDSHSAKTFQKEIKLKTGIVFIKKLSRRSPKRREAIRRAAKIPGVKAIVISEPEKVHLVECIPQLVRPILANTYDAVIPKRNEALFESSYPKYMYQSEKEGNRLFNDFLKTYNLLKNDAPDLDIFFGPSVMANKPKVLNLFSRPFLSHLGSLHISNEFLDPEEISNTYSLPVVTALKRKMKVGSVEIPFKYSAKQKENEMARAQEYFQEKRRFQRLGMLVHLMVFLSSKSS